MLECSIKAFFLGKSFAVDVERRDLRKRDCNRGQARVAFVREPKIRTLIVDDEPLARERIREMLGCDADVEVVGECRNGREAVASVKKFAPDILFLDVQMPGMDGFAVLKALRNEPRLPFVIFVTAYDQYAVRAFEVNALDYILKPFRRQRFEQTLTRVKQQLCSASSDNLGQRTLALLQSLEAKSNYLDRLTIKSQGKVFFVKVEEIDWIESEDNYLRLHLGKQSHLLRGTLTSLEAQLDPRKLVRIHRRVIVNLDRIKELTPWFNRDYHVVLHDGTELTLSRGYRQRLSHLRRFR